MIDNSGKSDYVPSEKEGSVLRKNSARRESQIAAPRIKISRDPLGLVLDHPHERIGVMLLMEALGTTDPDFLNGILQQLNDLVGCEFDEVKLNFMISVIKSIQPKDQLEVLLAAQMVAVHIATMKLASELYYVERMPHYLDSNERAFNKLTRTFVSQMEALRRYRTGSEQTVAAQHVSVQKNDDQSTTGNAVTAPGTVPQRSPSPPRVTDLKVVPMKSRSTDDSKLGATKRRSKG